MKITWLIELSTIRVLNLFIFSKASFCVEDFMDEDAINKKKFGSRRGLDPEEVMDQDGILYFSTIYKD